MEALGLKCDENTTRPGGSTDLEAPNLEESDEESNDETDMEVPGLPHQEVVEATTNSPSHGRGVSLMGEPQPGRSDEI